MQQYNKRDAKVTGRGIQVNEKLYSCSLAIRDGWFERAIIEGEWGVIAFQYPFCNEFYFIQHDNEMITCRPIEIKSVNSEDLEAYYEIIRALKEYRRHRRKLQ
ncbi:hypothetical protein [Paenibacillus sp. FSL H8-0537]|uniref:hypothetical protein n=1 Tax=Paenibacillus sp. FSL H8-0537 TaxID=2921399 RepID=UPI0031012618